MFRASVLLRSVAILVSFAVSTPWIFFLWRLGVIFGFSTFVFQIHSVVQQRLQQNLCVEPIVQWKIMQHKFEFLQAKQNNFSFNILYFGSVNYYSPLHFTKHIWQTHLSLNFSCQGSLLDRPQLIHLHVYTSRYDRHSLLIENRWSTISRSYFRTRGYRFATRVIILSIYFYNPLLRYG